MPWLTETNPFNPQLPAGPHFTGRHLQLERVSSQVDALEFRAGSTVCLVGRAGEGKTSFLDQVVAQARVRGCQACRTSVDVGRTATANVDAIMRALLREVDAVTAHGAPGLEAEWASGGAEFRTPRLPELRSDDLELDLDRALRQVPQSRIGCVLCVDEAQRLHPDALVVFKNALQRGPRSLLLIFSVLNDTLEPNPSAAERILDALAVRSGDPGASRYFKYNTLPLGPFESLTVAHEAIRRRLVGNAITFTDEAVGVVVGGSGGNPAQLMARAHRVYESARRSGQRVVSEEMASGALLPVDGSPARARRDGSGRERGRYAAEGAFPLPPGMSPPDLGPSSDDATPAA